MAKNKKNRWLSYAACTVAAAFAVIVFTAPYGEIFKAQVVYESKAVPPSSFVPVQFSFLPELFGALFSTTEPVYGLSIGGMVCQKEIYGLSFAGMHAYNQKKSGLSFSLIDACHESTGVSVVAGGGAVDNKGLAMGLWNLAENNYGVQFGLINQTKPSAIIEAPGDNKDKKSEGFGVQAGIYNESEGKGIQFGLWNVNSRALIKYMPFFNIAL